MNAPGQSQPPDRDEEDERDRRAANIFLVVCFILITGAGLWLVNTMVAQRDLDNCMAQGRRNCGQPVSIPGR
jgi:hypothetical protein